MPEYQKNARPLDYGIDRDSSARRKRAARIAVFISAAALILLLGPFFCSRMMASQTGTSATRAGCPVRSLPADATQISYYVPAPMGPWTAYEFNTSPAMFKAWAAKNGWPLKPIVGGTSVRRFDWSIATIPNGVEYFWQEDDSSRQVIYDSSTGRAYYQYSSR